MLVSPEKYAIIETINVHAMPRHAEQSIPQPSEIEKPKRPRKHVDAGSERLGARQIRGEHAGKELVSTRNASGKQKEVYLSGEEIRQAEERADRDFERAIAAAAAGTGIDRDTLSALLTPNKEHVLALAKKGQEADAKRALYATMEDIVESMGAYAGMVDDAVSKSGYTGIVAEGLRDSLLAERDRIIGEAIQHTSAPRARRTLESAIKAKFLSEASKEMTALAETVGPADVEDIHDLIGQLRIAEKESGTNPDLLAEVNRLDRQVQQDVAHWATQYLTEHPRASVQEVMNEAAKRELDEFLTERDVKRLKEGAAVGDLFKRAERERGYRVVEPETVEIIDDVEDAEEPTPVTAEEYEEDEMPDATLRPSTGDEDEIPDVSEHLKEDTRNEPAKKGFLSGLARTGRRLMLGMALLLGIKAVEPGHRLPHQEDQGPERAPSAMMEEAADTTAAPEAIDIGDDSEGMGMEQDDAPIHEATHDAEPDYPRGDARNLKRALRILNESGLPGRLDVAKERVDNLQGALRILDESGLPSKAEYQKMKTRERMEEIKAATARMEAMREIGSMRSPAIDASKRADLRRSIEEHQQFLELMKTVRGK